MAQLMTIRSVCDRCLDETDPALRDNLPGADDLETHTISIDGNPREIDLCPDHIKQVHELTDFLNRQGRPMREPAKRGRPPGSTAGSTRAGGGSSYYNNPADRVPGLQTRKNEFLQADGLHHCPDCDATSGTAQGLAMHRRMTHLDTDMIPCPVCGKPCKGKQGLSMHRVAHTGTQVVTCPECRQQFDRKSALQSHIRAKHPGSRARTANTIPGIG